MRYKVVIPQGTYGYNDCFLEPAEGVLYGLRGLGYEASLQTHVPNLTFADGETSIILGANTLHPDVRVPPGTIIYNLDQRDTAHLDRTLPAASCPGVIVWDYSIENMPFWQSKNIPCVHVPIGYVPELTRIPASTKDIDVYFTGWMNPRRQAIISSLTQAGIKVMSTCNSFGTKRDGEMARAKIILNIHHYESKIFEIVRVSYALANRMAVVTEQSADDHDYEWLKGGVANVPVDQLVQTCKELLADPERLKALGEAGFKHFSKVDEREILRKALGGGMKVLVAITSCARDVANGVNQAIRETWVPQLKQYGYDYRFVIGVGQTPDPSTFHPRFAEQFQSRIHTPGAWRYRPEDAKSIPLDHSLLKGDELLVEADDSYAFLPYKIRESRRWASAQGYDFIMKVDADAYLNPAKLHASQFPQFDYWGSPASGSPTNMPVLTFAGGWDGYMLSKKAYEITMNAPVHDFDEDVWTALVLRDQGIRVTNWRAEKPVVTAPAAHGRNSAQWMRDLHNGRPAGMVSSLPPIRGSSSQNIALVVLASDNKQFEDFCDNAMRFEPATRKILVRSGNAIPDPSGWEIVQGTGDYCQDLNVGFHRAGGDDIMLCSTNMRFLDSQTSKWLRDVGIKAPRIGLLSPKVEGGKGVQGNPLLLPHLALNPWSVAISGESLEPLCLFIRRELINQLGTITNPDLSQVIRAAGLMLAVTPHKRIRRA